MKPGPGPALDVTATNVFGPQMLPEGHLLAGRYRILELLGMGGMGMVYRARDEELGLVVAVKVLRPERAASEEMRDRFRREIILARQVTHGNVVRIHDLGQEGELLFLTMDYVEGRSLTDLLEQEGPLPEEEVLPIFRQLALALGAAHRQGVIHRDLKPANILVDPVGGAYITDFGIARSVAATGMTGTGQILGTPEYLSPEQAKGEPLDHRTDIYSLGLIIFELLTGASPFPGGTLSELLGQRISGRPRGLEELGVAASRPLRRVLGRCLRKDPEDRYRTAEELLEDLDGEGIATGDRWRRLRRRLPWPAASPWLRSAAVATVLAVLAVGWLTARSRGVPPASGDPAAPAPRYSVAVLPLADETGREELAWTSTGIAEMVAAALAESPELRVVDSLRVLRTLEDLKLAPGRLTDPELRLTAEMLDADRLVVGSLRSSAQALRAEAQLVAADRPDLPRQRLFAEAVGGEGIFSLIDQLSGELRGRLEVGGALRGSPAAARLPPTEALRAFAAGLEASRRGDDLEAAPELRRAVEAFPEFSAAWVRLAETSERLGYQGEALAAAKRAVELTEEGVGRIAYEARARLAAVQGRPEEARRILSELVDRFPHEIEVRVSLAEAYAEEGALEVASRHLTEVVKRDTNHPRAWFLLGKFAIFQGQSRQAIDRYLVHALVVQNRLGNAQGKADVLNAMGAAAQQLGDLEDAEERYREAAGLRRSIGDQRGYSASLTNLAAIQALEGSFVAAEDTLAEALAIREAIGDQPGIARVLNQRGLLAEQRGRYREALGSFRKALELRRRLGDQRDLAESHGNVAFAYYMLGEYDNATLYWQQALERYRQGGNRAGEVQTLQSVAQLALARGAWEEASRSLLEALETSRELELRSEEAASLGYLGRLAQLQGRYGAALESYAQVLELLGEVADPRGLGEFGLFEAGCLLEIGALEPAGEKLEQLRALLGPGANRDQVSELLRLEAELAAREGRISQARARAAEAASEATASGSVSAELRAQLTLGRMQLAAGEVEKAREALSSGGADAEDLGDVPLRLSAGDALARALLLAGRPAEAEEVGRANLSLAASREPVAGHFRYHSTLAEVLEARGASADAREQRRRAATEVERLRRDLPASWRDEFDHLPEVRALASQSTPSG